MAYYHFSPWVRTEYGTMEHLRDPIDEWLTRCGRNVVSSVHSSDWPLCDHCLKLAAQTVRKPAWARTRFGASAHLLSKRGKG